MAMTKLEEKLIELGYIEIKQGHYFNGLVNFVLTYDKTKLIDGWVKSCPMRHKIDLDINTQAYKQLQKDLEVLENE